MDQKEARVSSIDPGRSSVRSTGDLKPWASRSLFPLGIAFIFYLLCAGSWAMVPVAAWLAPVFALRFIRNQKAMLGSVLVLLVILVAALISSQSVLRGSGAEAAGKAPIYIVLLGVLLSLRWGLPLIIDRLLVHRIGGFLATLVFPLASVVVEYLYIQGSPFLSIGSVAYTQFGDLPLTQIVSVTGIWGLIFLIAWFGSVANWVWEMNCDWSSIKRGAVVSAGVFALVVAFGGLRTSVFAPRAATVQVSGIVATPEILALQPRLDEEDEWTAPRWRANSRTVFEYFINRTQEQAHAGSKIVAWQEYAVYVFPEDEATFIDRGREIARRERIYLMMGLCIGPSAQTDGLAQNKLVWVCPDGESKEYLKSHPTGLENIRRGNGEPVVIDTPYGRIASAICFDMDQPTLPRRAGRAGVDMFIVPAFDWSGFTPMHTNIASFRGIENGASLVRIGGKTLTCAYDYQGRILGSAEFSRSSGAVMIAHVPTRGVRTIYSSIGDLPVWLCAGAFLVMIGFAVLRSRRASRTNAGSC